MAIGIRHYFNEEMPALLSRHADEAVAIGARYQINVPSEGEWHLDCTSTGPTCRQGTADADCTVTIQAEDFEHLLANPRVHGPELYFAMKLKVGLKVPQNTLVAAKLATILAFK